MIPGDIYLHRRFYVDCDTGEFKGKYLIVLAITPGRDLVIRLLTSRSHGRPEQPPCFHGDPYPGFFLGIPGEPLNRPTWIDLRHLNDADPLDFRRDIERSVMAHVVRIAKPALRTILDCAANANDTTRLQERALRDELAR